MEVQFTAEQELRLGRIAGAHRFFNVLGSVQ
jgi:hypothetical protein